MQLQTIIDLPSFPFRISHTDKLSLVGSCFANNMGKKFVHHKFKTLSNPFGVLYNPMSVCECLDTIISNYYNADKLIQHQGVWHSLAHHSTFSKVDREDCLSGINKGIAEAHKHLRETSVLLLTFGTAQVFEKEGTIVSNCHKLPAKTFTRRRLSVAEIVAKVSHTINSLKAINPTVKIIFTVSPVRYAKDGMHENSLSKATLLLAIEQLCERDDCSYFPAYEIILDELRDYRFFTEDMIHPSDLCIDYVWEKIKNSFFDSSTQLLNKQINKITTAANHRPFNTDPDAHQLFLDNMHKKASDLQSQHPEIDLSTEMGYFRKR